MEGRGGRLYNDGRDFRTETKSTLTHGYRIPQPAVGGRPVAVGAGRRGDRRQDPLVMLGWVAWAGSAMALLRKRVGEYLGRLNAALRKNQAELEARIAERTRALQEAQAHVLHQEKMAAFGLLAAGIAHEVGNPLTSISALVQLLQRRDCDGYTRERLALVNGQLQRIQTTLRELVNFSRPASSARARVSVREGV